jgi:Methylamine utilisation protein MauE
MTGALDPAIEAIVRLALALLFLASAVEKLRAPESFRAALRGYELLPELAVPPAAAALALAEGVLGVALAVPAWRAQALPAGAALLGLYAAAIAVNLARGRRHIDCGCAGPGLRQPIHEWQVARNALLAGAALACLAPLRPRALGPVDAVTVAGGVAVASAAWASLHRLLASTRALRAHGSRP